MNWRKAAVWLWPPCALIFWPFMAATGKTMTTTLPRYAENLYDLYLLDAFPHFTIPFLVTFALSVVLWLERPSMPTFLGTLFVSWVFLGRPDSDIIAIMHFRGTLFPYGIISPSAHLTIIAVVLLSPYIFVLLRRVLRH